MELFTRWHTWDRTEPELRRLLPAPACDAVARAVTFALAWHGDQRRPTGVPYAEHLLEALEFLVRGAGVSDADVLSAVVLHDVVEDTPCTISDVRAAFGERVAGLVGWVTKPEPGPGSVAEGLAGPGGPDGSRAARSAAKEAYLQGLADAPDDAILVKLADRGSNVQTLRNLAPAKQREYYAQTVRYIMPLAASRGWWALWYASWQEAHLDLA